jgi:RNase P subunit RPR2
MKNMKRKTCTDCGAALKKDETALSKKMLGREITRFYCIHCLAAVLDCEAVDLAVKIQEFKEQGCALFL